LSTLQDWAGKLVGTVIRLAGILHMAEYVNDRRPWDVAIAADTMAKAVQIGRYLIAHARAAFGEMAADPVVDDAKYTLAWVRRRGASSFTVRDAFEGCKGRFKKVDLLWPALRLLEDHGFIHRQPDPDRTGPGRKPSPTYEVNPYTLSQNPRNSPNAPVTSDDLDLARILREVSGLDIVATPESETADLVNSASDVAESANQMAQAESETAELEDSASPLANAEGAPACAVRPVAQAHGDIADLANSVGEVAQPEGEGLNGVLDSANPAKKAKESPEGEVPAGQTTDDDFEEGEL
jgi:hypothetical protein